MDKLILNMNSIVEYFFSSNWYFYFSTSYFSVKKILNSFILNEFELKPNFASLY